MNLPTIAELKIDCHRLIEAIARRPGAIKLLLCAQRALRTFADYKTNRQTLTQRKKHD